MIYNPLYRINANSLIKIIDVTDDVKTFGIVKSEIGSTFDQYVLPEDINKTVWDSGTFEHRLNKVALELPLYELTGTEDTFTGDYYDLRLLIPQGYNWTGVFGLHLIVKSLNDNSVLFSKIFGITDFLVTGNKELIEGVFWMEEAKIFIPNIGANIACNVTEIKFTDINAETGLIYNYSPEVVPLIEEKLLPDYINNFINIDDNHYITFGVKTTENKTVEKSILDYFGLQQATIKIEHIIDYGNSISGYKTFKISNEDNKYTNLNIGLNLTQFIGQDNNVVEIILTTQIWVDSKLMKRSTTINTDLDSILPLITDQITHPDTNYPVNVEIVNEINQTVIESKEKTKFIEIYQPLFVEMINDSFYYELKNISFDKLIKQTYLKILASGDGKEQTILSTMTSDGRYLFDLSKLIPITSETVYELIDTENNFIIGVGKVLIK